MSDDYNSCGCHGWKSWFSLGRKLSWDRPDAYVVDVVGPVGPRRGGEESCWGNIFVEILGFGIFWRQKACHGWNLIGGGAAGGAPVPQLGLPQPGAGPGPEWDWYWPWMPWKWRWCQEVDDGDDDGDDNNKRHRSAKQVSRLGLDNFPAISLSSRLPSSSSSMLSSSSSSSC